MSTRIAKPRGTCPVCKGPAWKKDIEACQKCRAPKPSYCACGAQKTAKATKCDRCHKQRMTTFRPIRAHVVEDCRHHYVLPPPDGPIALGVCKHCGKTKVHRNSDESDYAPFAIAPRQMAEGVLGVSGKRRTR